MLRKINSILALITALLVTMHMIMTTTAILLQTGATPPMPVTIMMIVCFILHAVLSLILVFVLKDGVGIGHYMKVHKQTVLQRISGMAILVLGLVHIISSLLICAGHYPGIAGIMIIWFSNLIFYLAVLYHVKLSLTKAFVSLGIFTEEIRIFILERFFSIFFIILGIYVIGGTFIDIIRMML